MKFGCQLTQQGLQLNISPHEGTHPAWWKEIRVEIYGWTPKDSVVTIDSKRVALNINRGTNCANFSIPDDGKGAVIAIH
jgi:alpha-glucosidase